MQSVVISVGFESNLFSCHFAVPLGDEFVQVTLVCRFATEQEAGSFLCVNISLWSGTCPSTGRERMETWGLLCASQDNVNAALEVLGLIFRLNLWNHSLRLECWVFFTRRLEAPQELHSAWVCSCRGHFGLGVSLKNWMKRVGALVLPQYPVAAAARLLP